VTAAVPTPPAAQVRALLDRAANGHLNPDEQRLAGQLLRQARAASYRTAALDEVRDALTAAGHGRAEVTDWPDVMPALTDLIAERDRYRAAWQSARRRAVQRHNLARHNNGQTSAAVHRALAAETERDQLRKQLAARVEPGTVDCPRCPAPAGRRCKSPSGQIVNWHSERIIRAQQQAAGVGQ
jgi:hypothetical protein